MRRFSISDVIDYVNTQLQELKTEGTINSIDYVSVLPERANDLFNSTPGVGFVFTNASFIRTAGNGQSPVWNFSFIVGDKFNASELEANKSVVSICDEIEEKFTSNKQYKIVDYNVNFLSSENGFICYTIDLTIRRGGNYI